MLKRLPLLLSFTILFSIVDAQKTLKKTHNKVRCFTVEVLAKKRLKNPNIATDAQFEGWMKSKIAERKNAVGLLGVENGTTGNIVNYTLPIVFHIIHKGESVGIGTNLSKDLINHQVIQLNKDYANLSGSPYAVSSATGIKFALATKDPNGNTLAEPGIDRINYSSKGFTAPPYDDNSNYITETMKPATIWDPTKYVNIWVMDMSASGILGFATFPGASTLAGLDETETNSDAGVVIDPTTVGSIFSGADCGVTNAYELGRTLTHELGHFFGLRHIWGDSNCGDDFCDDTPVHYDANYGKMAHPKPNSCGTADEMFENYMDYSDDQMTNTFTANQVDRMQVVMVNSTRRKTLATSNVPTVSPSIAANTVAFSNCSGKEFITESGTDGTTNRFKILNFPVSLASPAASAVTLTITTSGTAVKGSDYELNTSSVTFNAGEFAKNIALKIIDNAKVDGVRTIVLGYTISGTGASAGPSAQTLTIYLFDDDNIIVGQNSVNLFSEDFTAGAIPTGWNTYQNGTNQFVVGTSGNAGGSGACAYVTGNTTSKPNTYVNSVGYAILETPMIDASRVTKLGTLSFKYTIRGRTYSYNSNTNVTTGHYGFMGVSLANDASGGIGSFGTTNGVTGYGPYANSASAISNTTSIGATSYNNARFYLDFYFEVANSATPNNPALNVDNIVLTATPFAVETAVNTSYAYSIPSGTSVNNFKSKAGNAIGAIANANAVVADVTASVVEAGTDRLNITTGASTYLRSRKAIKFAPATANNTVQSTVTLYFTSTEVSAWGAGALTAKVLKVQDGTALSANLNTQNAVVLTPTVTDKRATDAYIAYTVTSTGYGTYVLVESTTVLPVNWVDFKGTIENNQTKLVWSTTNELQNSGFEVERSVDGAHFTKIGWVKGTNSSNINNYSFIDNNIAKGNRYYYRLKQIDVDGRYSYSTVISILYLDANKSFNVLPNPFVNKLVIQNNGNFRGNTTVVITDINGKVVYNNSVLTANVCEVNSQNWSKGMYLIRLNTPIGVNVFKVVKD